MKQPKVGQKIYIPSKFHISNGSDDVQGGLATIDLIKINNDLPEDHYNRVFVGFKEIPTSTYNWNHLMENQEEYTRRYAGRVAHPDPDIDTPWIQNGDIVNGEKWTQGNVW